MNACTESKKTINEALRFMAGLVTLLGLGIGYFLSEWGYVLVLFVSLNLIQSSFTGWCPAMVIFRKIGLKD